MLSCTWKDRKYGSHVIVLSDNILSFNTHQCMECNRSWNVALRLIAIGCWVDWLFKPFVPSLVQHGRIYPQHHQPPPQLSTFSSELNQKLIAAFQTFWAVISWNPPKDHLPHSVPAPAAHQHDNFPQSIQWPTFSSSCCNQRHIQKTHTFYHYHVPTYNLCILFKSFYRYLHP